MKLGFSSPKLGCRATPKSTACQDMHVVLPLNYFDPTVKPAWAIDTERDIGSRCRTVYVCLSQKRWDRSPSFHRRARRAAACCVGVAPCSCLAHVRGSHTGSDAVTSGANGHTKAFLLLSKRLIRVTFRLLAAMLGTKNLQRDALWDGQSASRVYRGCYKYYQLYRLVHIRTEILTLSKRAGALPVAVLWLRFHTLYLKM